MTRVYWTVGVALTVAALAASGYFYGRLPESIPTHWNIHGQVDGHGPRWTIFIMPAVMVAVLGLFRGLPWLSPKGFEVDSFRRTYLFVMATVVGLFAYMYGVILYATIHEGVDPGRVLIGGIFLFIVFLGNVMGKLRRNFYIGVRTPWTLASERVWVDTHRLAGWTMVAGGLIGFVLAIAGWLVPAFVVLMVACVIPALYSLVLYKRLERAGQL
jgi:uncharacterized membrane protein